MQPASKSRGISAAVLVNRLLSAREKNDRPRSLFGNNARQPSPRLRLRPVCSSPGFGEVGVIYATRRYDNCDCGVRRDLAEDRSLQRA